MKPTQAAVAGSGSAGQRSMVRTHLGHNGSLVTAPRECLADQGFSEDLSVHLGGVYEPAAKVQAEPERRQFVGAVGQFFAPNPGPHAQ